MPRFRKLVFKLIQWEGIESAGEPEEENIRVVGFTNKAILIVFGFTDPKNTIYLNHYGYLICFYTEENERG